MFLSATGKGDTEYHIQKRFSLSLNAMPLISLRALAIMLRTTRSQEAPIRDTITADEYKSSLFNNDQPSSQYSL